ncbi:hypothetical protein BP422_11770 [Brevibacillus formosus]|uniref:Tyr recombinase domain-containing protein n=2 Tax=Brevibacillus formosus TaxID=54913 RepID=A0A220MR37_9BACL|nr:hypothetical protein BP422_11770 [Brevibacillus formosus]
MQNVSQYPLLVFDQENRRFKPLTVYYKKLLQQFPEGTSMTYLNVLLPFFSWLSRHSSYQGNTISWDESCEIIQEAIHDYLIHKLSCKIRDHHQSNKVIHPTLDSPKTIRIFLSALKKFYGFMIREGMYKFPNPLIDAGWAPPNHDFTAATAEMRPRMPDIAGTEPKRNRYISDSYFVITGEQWIPEIIDDIQLPAKVFRGGELSGWTIREQLIARMLFECGARISEIILLTVGDYRRRSAAQEFTTFSKGSNGRRVKFIRLSNETITLFFRYMNGERKEHDPQGATFNDLPDNAPVFLTQRGDPFNYHAWYPHWRRGCRAANIQLNPHKVRHWYVTQALREIYETTQQDNELHRKINQLIEYIKWKDKETIHVYEHYFDAKKHREIQDKLFKKLQEEVNTYKPGDGNHISSNVFPSKNAQKAIELNDDEDFLTDFFS